MGFFGNLIGKKSNDASQIEALWQRVYDARASLYERHFGKLPNDILKLMDLSGVWPGGGLYAISAEKLGAGKMVYASFGLSNPDMPATLEAVNVENARDGRDRLVQTSMTLKKKEHVRPKTDKPGYGYELIVVAEENAEWPLWILQWAVKAEIGQDADILARVEKYKGLTVEQVQVGPNAFVNLLFSKAQAPIIASLDLPNGNADVLVATVITDEEMQWSAKNGRDALLDMLMRRGVGQVSKLGRASVIDSDASGSQQASVGPQLTEDELMQVRSREMAVQLVKEGKLCTCLLFPAELGGQDVPPNTVYVTSQALERRAQAIGQLLQAGQQGLIDSLEVKPEYKAESFVTSKIHFLGKHAGTGKTFGLTVDIW